VPAAGGTDLGAGRGEVPFSQPLTGLAPGTWWTCAIASGAGGTAFGELLRVEVAAPPAAPAGGCGCGAGAVGGAGPLWLAALLLLRRRRSLRSR
jgi:MYXO-CTERM domain-containing protein